MNALQKNGGWLVAAVVGVAVLLFMGHPTEAAGFDARALVKNGAVLLDVRSPGEFAAGHLAGAVNVPHDAVTGAEPELRGHRNDDVVVYCHSGRRSALAVATLRAAGFTKLHDLGAMSNW